MISIRRAQPSDAVSIGAVHVAAWRSTYPGILPDAYLARLSVHGQAMHYDQAIRAGLPVYVASASGADTFGGTAPRIVGFSTGSRARGGEAAGRALAESEIETLYVLDDFRDRGIGRRLMRAMALQLAAVGCRSAYLWVLRGNPSRWFYERLGGQVVAASTRLVAGQPVPQIAMAWNPIERLLQASPQTPEARR